MEEEKVSIGVIGVGFVGGAVFDYFLRCGLDVITFDKKESFRVGNEELEYKTNSFEELLSTDYVFLCLPTPYIKGFGFDYTALHENLLKLKTNKYKGTIIIKSTMEPGTTRMLSEKYSLPMVHNPEFLTARTALEDFKNQKHIVIGGFDMQTCGNVLSLYQKYFKAQYTICDSEQAELMKLFCNNFYAVKVQLFNEFALTCKRMGVDYNSVKDSMLRNGWINPMHTDVPGPDGQFSYGGLCFPKDTNALRDYMKRNGIPYEILDACISERNKMRDD